MSVGADEILWWLGPVPLTATVVFTWIAMAVLVGGAALLTRGLGGGLAPGRREAFLEICLRGMQRQIREVSHQEPGPFLPFVGTLFLFIATCNLLAVVPGFRPPTGSLSTTAALATCVFVAVPVFGVARRGVRAYLGQYLKPSPFMLPFNVIGELSRTLALAVRLYGNIMSGTVIGAILLGFVPLFVPVLMQLFGLLTGMVQAYIFSILAMVYIASASRTRSELEPTRNPDDDDD